MRLWLKISLAICLITSVTLIANLFDIVSLPTILFRICGVACVISLFFMVYLRVLLIRYRRKPMSKQS